MSKIEGERIRRVFLYLVSEPNDIERVEGATHESKTGFPAWVRM
jgi:hypothetical protein